MDRNYKGVKTKHQPLNGKRRIMNELNTCNKDDKKLTFWVLIVSSLLISITAVTINFCNIYSRTSFDKAFDKAFEYCGSIFNTFREKRIIEVKPLVIPYNGTVFLPPTLTGKIIVVDRGPVTRQWVAEHFSEDLTAVGFEFTFNVIC